MSKMTPLKNKILVKSSALFRKYGYKGTSNKQIAKAAGCTTAALYYYFEGGKAHILREVIRSSISDPARMDDAIDDSRNLEEFLAHLNQTLARDLPHVTDRLSWLTLEFPNLPKEEQGLLQEQILAIHDVLRRGISRFVDSKAEAAQLAWVIFCAYFGYQQVFMKMGIRKLARFDIGRFGQVLTHRVTSDMGRPSPEAIQKERHHGK
jgi:AcrR family transcriptional regulator